MIQTGNEDTRGDGKTRRRKTFQRKKRHRETQREKTVLVVIGGDGVEEHCFGNLQSKSLFFDCRCRGETRRRTTFIIIIVILVIVIVIKSVHSASSFFNSLSSSLLFFVIVVLVFVKLL